MNATEKKVTATIGWDGSWWIVVYRDDVMVARSPDYMLKLDAERWLLNNYPEAELMKP